jgi:transposase
MYRICIREGELGVITLKQKQEIILKSYREGKSQRAIARETGIDRKTVSKYIKTYQQAKQELIQSVEITRNDQIDLITNLVAAPKYQVANRAKRRLTDDMVHAIEYYLEENEFKKQNGQAKQQKKIIDIHEALLKAGHQISYPTVRNTVSALRKSGKEAFIRIDYAPGDICEFDWGDANLYIDGQLKTFQIAIFTSAYGNYRYAQLFHQQRTECFIESHVLFFEHIDGVYHTVVYDNMKVAVRKFVGLHEKEPTVALTKLSMYYGFNFRFCNIRAGNEKGHVEKSVEYVRRKAFCDMDHFDTLEQANKHLLEVCIELNQKPQIMAQKQTSLELMAVEQDFLLPAMPKYESARIETSRVDKYSTISIDTCHYSVPDNHVNKFIFTKVYSTLIRCFYEGIMIAEHRKCYGNQQWSIDIGHYCRTFKRKPGALSHSVALKQADKRLQHIYQAYYINKEKSFIDLLLFSQECSIEKIEQAITTLKKVTPTDITTEKIKLICQRVQSNYQVAPMLESTIVEKSKEHLESYNTLLPFSVEKFNMEVAIV